MRCESKREKERGREECTQVLTTCVPHLHTCDTVSCEGGICPLSCDVWVCPTWTAFFAAVFFALCVREHVDGQRDDAAVTPIPDIV